MPPSPTTIDDYLAAVKPDQRAALEDLRQTIRALVPDAEECISYQVPAFRHGKRKLVAFGAAAKHCSFYPMSGTVLADFAEALRDFETSKGTIRFQPDKPLPEDLVKRVVEARLAENLALDHKAGVKR